MSPEEFCGKLSRAQKEFPLATEMTLEQGAQTMVKALRKNSPASKKRRRKIKKSWRMEMTSDFSGTPEAHIYNKSPHFHLVERGHIQKTRGGRVTGFVQGTHFVEKTLDDEGSDIQKQMGEKLLKALEGVLQ